MNRASTSASKKRSKAASAENRDLFVIDDYASMPWTQSRPLFPTAGSWIAAGIRHKLLRKPVEANYAVECGRFVSARHVPKRIEKYFEEVIKDLRSHAFIESFTGTVAAVGPYSNATLGMSRKDGLIHFFATQIVTQVNRRIHDEQFFGFVSWAKNDESVWTLSPSRLPPPRREADRFVTNLSKPGDVLRKHQERIRHVTPRQVSPADFFDEFEAENVKQVNDWVSRGVIRPANPAEVTRIRNEMGV